MNQYKIEFSEEAKNDLTSTVSYIKYNLQEPNIAKKLAHRIQKGINDLAKDPKIYKVIEDDFIKKFDLRKIGVGNYLIFYRVIEETRTIEIVRILYGRRNWMKML